MGWSYRVIKESWKEGGFTCDGRVPHEHDFTFFRIHEVHYTQQEGCEGGAGCQCPIESVSANPVHPYGATPEELKGDLELMLKAFDRPVLEHNDVKHLFDEKDEPEDEAAEGEAAEDD